MAPLTTFVIAPAITRSSQTFELGALPAFALQPNPAAKPNTI